MKRSRKKDIAELRDLVSNSEVLFVAYEDYIKQGGEPSKDRYLECLVYDVMKLDCHNLFLNEEGNFARSY